MTISGNYIYWTYTTNNAEDIEEAVAKCGQTIDREVKGFCQCNTLDYFLQCPKMEHMDGSLKRYVTHQIRSVRRLLQEIQFEEMNMARDYRKRNHAAAHVLSKYALSSRREEREVSKGSHEERYVCALAAQCYQIVEAVYRFHYLVPSAINWRKQMMMRVKVKH